MNQKERDKLKRIEQVQQGLLGTAQAAQMLDLTQRQVQRILKDYQARGDRALGHIGGRESLQALLGVLGRLDPEALDQTVAALVEIDNEAALLPLICLYEKVENPVLRRRISAALARLAHDPSLLDPSGTPPLF